MTLAFAGLAGCGGGGASNTAETAEPLITYRVSGGIGGISQRLTIFSDRSATLAGGRGPYRSTDRFTLAKAELSSLAAKLEVARLDSLPKPRPSRCADCFEYGLEYRGASYDANDVSLSDRVTPVITALNAIIAAHGRSGAAPAGGVK